MLASFVTVAALFATSAFAILLEVPSTIAQCDTLHIHAAGSEKLNVAVLLAEDECGDALKEWIGVESGVFNHTVKAAVGTKLSILNEQQKNDSEKWATVTVVAGSSDCVEGAATSASGSDSAAFVGSTATVGNTNGFASPSQSAGGAKNVGTDPNADDETTDGASALGVSALAVAVGVVAALL